MDNQSENFSKEQSPAETVNFFKRHERPLWAALITLAVAVAATLTYVLFFRSSAPPAQWEGDAKLTIEAPASTPSGSEVSYRIRVENRSGTQLGELSLELFYPTGFTLLDSTPDAQEDGARRFALRDLAPGRETMVVVVGRLSGDLQEIKTLSAKLRYVPQNFRSPFVAEASGRTLIEAPALTMRLNSPVHLVSGQNITYELLVTNVSDQVFSDLVANFIFPEKFILPVGEGADIPIPELAIGQSRTVTVKGKLPADPGTDSLVEAALKRPGPGGEQVTVGRAYAFTKILPSPLAVSHALTVAKSEIGIPDRLEFSVQYENQSQTGLNNVAIAVVFSSFANSSTGAAASAFSLLEVTSETGQKKGATLLWAPGNNKDLAVVTPGETGRFNYMVNIPARLAETLYKNPLLSTRIEYVADELTEPISGNSLSYPIGTNLGVLASAKAVSGDTYLVELTLTNSVNDADGTELVAIIPGVNSVFDYTSVSPAEERANAEFNPSSGILRWRLGEVFAFSGAFHAPRKLSFLLTTPDRILLRDIQATGKDRFTGRETQSNKIPVLQSNGF